LDWESGHCNYEDICFISRQVAATALRAAADQVGQVPADLASTEWRRGFSEGVRLAYRELYAIAAELEDAGA
jgi:hypothetical protein